MKHFLLFLAYVSGGIGIWMNSIFFYGIIGNGLYAFIYAIVGIITDTGKFSVTHLFAISLALNKAFEGIMLTIFWIVATGLSLMAAFGFFSNAMDSYEQTALLGSQIYEENLLRVDNARTKVESLAIYADTNQANKCQTKRTKLENELANYLNQPAYNYNKVKVGTVGSRVGECIGENYYKRQHCPHINQLKSKIWKCEQRIENHANYLSAVSYQQSQSDNMSTITTTGGHVLPGFKKLGNLLGINPETVSTVFTIIAAITLELFPSLCLFIRARFWPSPIQFEDAQLTNYAHTNYKTRSPQFVQNQSVSSSINRLPFIGKLSAGKDDQRIKHARKALLDEVIKPSKYGLRQWSKRNGGLLSDGAIASFQREWLEEGLIEEWMTANNKRTYRLIK